MAIWWTRNRHGVFLTDWWATKSLPYLWNKVRRGLSAGRVQTVALRLIVEREVQIREFVPQEYWSIHAMLDAGEPPLFEAKLFKHKGEDVEVSNQEAADKIVAAVSDVQWQVANVTQKEKRRNPPPPFTTSKLQQAAYNRLRYTAKRTMSLAQKLYEGVELGEEGSVALITYMRTDSVNVSADALAQVREMIPERFGSNYLPEKPNYYKSKKDAPGSSRGGAADRCHARARRCSQISGRRSFQALSIDLAALRCVTNVARDFRSNHD